MQSISRYSAGLVILVLAMSACGDDGGDDGNGDPVDARPPDAQPAPDAVRYDAMPMGNACDRVDLLFALDGSSTMREELQALVQEGFPATVTRLRDIGGGVEDYRVGVLDACPLQANLHTIGDDPESSNREDSVDCMFQSGEAWMDFDSTALEQEFACVANLYLGDYDPDGEYRVVCTGSGEDEERPIKTAIEALTTFSEPGQPNEGFMRDDALLLVVAISDEDEERLRFSDLNAPDYAQELYTDLVAAKGDVKRMVFLGIGGGPETEDNPDGGCSSADGAYGEADDAEVIRLTTELFVAEDRGVFWDLCDGNIEDGLEQAMNILAEICTQVD